MLPLVISGCRSDIRIVTLLFLVGRSTPESVYKKEGPPRDGPRGEVGGNPLFSPIITRPVERRKRARQTHNCHTVAAPTRSLVRIPARRCRQPLNSRDSLHQPVRLLPLCHWLHCYTNTRPLERFPIHRSRAEERIGEDRRCDLGHLDQRHCLPRQPKEHSRESLLLRPRRQVNVSRQ
jgi:hypothetical protein